MSGSDTICNGSDPPLADIVLFRLYLSGFPSRILKRSAKEDFHTLIKNVSFSSPTSVEFHRFISKEYISIGTRTFGETKSKSTRAYAESGQYHEYTLCFNLSFGGFMMFAGFFATYAKLYPTMKPYEYGFRVFLLTYCFIMVSGYRTRDFIHTAITRFLLIALGAGVCLVVNICIYPIWAGEDLHNLVVKNFAGVAASLEGCVDSYLNCVEYERIPSKILTYQASDDPLYKGYRSAMESMSQEESLMGFAIWEPPHGRYKMLKYPWKNYVEVAGALRHCAFAIMGLHGCILSEIQAPAERRHVFGNELRRVSYEGAKVLHELGNKLKKMETLDSATILSEVHDAAEELQKKIDAKSYLLVNSESWEIGNHHDDDDVGRSQELLNLDDEETRFHEYRSLSEAVLDLRAFPVPKTWNDPMPSDINSVQAAAFPPTNKMFKKLGSWPAQVSNKPNGVIHEEESKTYENASALSLATFTSLLIEFVARLQNVVDSFEELSKKAKFKDPMERETSKAPEC